MANVWDADVEINREKAQALLAAQFPALDVTRIEPFGIGWDNVAFLVEDRLVFRFPHRRMGAQLIAHEIAWLPRLAPFLPLPISVPAFVGAPAGDYPYPFAGYELLPGITACQIDWTESERAQCAVPLAQFVAQLHRIPIAPETREAAPGDVIERANIKKRVSFVRERLNTISPLLRGVEVGPLFALLDALADTPAHDGPTCWVHGDLYPRHLLANEARALCGVIDWGDVHLGDPALDLGIAFMFLPREAHSTFRAAYGPVSEAAWQRARFRALHHGVALVLYGAKVQDEAIRRVGDYALRAVL